MGIFPEARYKSEMRRITKGDLIMLFTDGLFEVEDAAGVFFTEQQLHATVSRHASLVPEEFFSRVVNDIRSFAQRESFADDVCVVGMQVQYIE
jgi:serine phosphatase RsbU (regulator of sigma subunit)